MAWSRGLLKYKLQDHQHELYEIFENATSIKTVVNASRRWGKTTVVLLYAIIYAITHPNSEIKIATKTQKALRKTMDPLWRMLLKDAPRKLRPKWSSKEECYVFFNGARMHIHGTDAQRHDGLRGQRCDLGIVDEASFCSDLRYIVQSILLPQTITCKGKIILLSTPEQKATPSGEEYKEFCIEAQRKGSYFCRDIYSNTSIDEETMQEYKDECGGEDSIEWQVEWLCKFKIDPEKAILAEWRTDKMLLDEDFEPEDNHFYKFYHRYTCLDLGVKRDWTVGLCAFYDFEAATINILNEFYVKNTTTAEIAARLKDVEMETFGAFPIYRRVCDSDNPQLVNDFVHAHKIGISATSKSTLEAMVNTMKILIGGGQVKVHPRCKLLIRTLENGVWANSMAGKLRQDFGRTKELGHMDAIAALMYLCRNVNRTSNPVPTTYGVSIANTLISNSIMNKDSHNKKEFKRAFVTISKRNKKSR